MAHLIKLEEYVSRYQFDLNRYPSQFSRMKKERWYYLKNEWEQAQLEFNEGKMEEEMIETIKEDRKWTNAFRRFLSWKHTKNEQPFHTDLNDINEEQFRLKSMTLTELKQNFLDELYISQLRWASSSLLEESVIHPQYKRDKWLRFFTQQLPDNYFVMYRPVFYIKYAPVDLDIVLISPAEIILITMIEGQEHSIFEASSDRFWIEYVNKMRKKRLSPLLSLMRMSGIIESILGENQFSFPIRRVIISPNSMIDNKVAGVSAELIDKRTFESWHENMKRQPSPLKHDQMKVTSILFDYCTKTIRNEEEEEIDEV